MTDGKPLRATIKHVSEHAGVSIKTVSRVLNNERYVGAETRARVQAAVDALHFRPNLAARALAGRRAFQIALVCDNPSPSYVYAMQTGIRDRCEADGVRMIAQPYDRASPHLAEQIEALVDTSRMDGIVLTPPVSDDAAVLDLLARRGIPVVRVSPGFETEDSAAVSIDNRGAAREMTAHLLSLGHRRIAHIGGHPDYATAAQRRDGYLAALADAGIATDPALIESGSYDFPSGAAAAERLLDLPQPPTAIFAGSDEMAAGALTAAHRRGLVLPRDLSVAGFGDDPLAGYVWPPLTTMRQPVRDLAWNAADLLLTADREPEHRRLDHRMVVRDSTAAPARR
ncbi:MULTISPECIES: LacI family DNA-binding transcriptional regulator [Sphingomonas]|uniref:LacI family transcriptional regulator n=1 Tax=Sphingomonas adhaesiva TaxID=28212 RepID=A0A2A4I8L4_9SPHN|nr:MULTISPECIES: LacI family DNA-binding transcriptional regulator [Sphingomonas]PCG15317.1 LacI family transcriptional regulator [Sphingomonas adhaesiva]PZU77532.1 MAG: LacI family DNA-binding transcriptional regulator [Sphingomonas sp.]